MNVLIYYVNNVVYYVFVFFFKQKTSYEMRISDWSSDVCSSDLAAADLLLQPVDRPAQLLGIEPVDHLRQERHIADLLDRRPGSRPATAAPSTAKRQCLLRIGQLTLGLLELFGERRDASRHLVGRGLERRRRGLQRLVRSEEHKSDLQPLMRISYT